jgi:hypothetical protein
MKFHRKNLLAAIILIGLGSFEFAQAQATKQQPRRQTKARPEFSLRVSTKNLLTFSLEAEKAPLANIAAELSKKLKVPVLLGHTAKYLAVTTSFKRITLEPAMQMLAPHVYIDYEVNPAPGAQPRPIGIYLNSYDDPEPAINAVVTSKSEAILIEGHTEEGTEAAPAEKEEPTKISFEQNYLSVTAKRQPLSVVLYNIAYELRIPFELKWESTDVVDVDIERLPLEEAMSRLSPHVRLYVRANLQNSERKPFRMVLVRPETGS